MRSYKHITYRYLKGQRNRTLLTLLGIILSVALVSAIGTIIMSVRGALIKDAIRQNGSHHAIFMDMDSEGVTKLKNHVGVSEVGISTSEGYGIVRETTEEEREEYGWNIPYRYLEIYGYDKNALDMEHFVDIKEGRLPETENELAIEYWMLDYFEEEIELGDKIKLTIGDRDIKDELGENDELLKREERFLERKEKEYTIVGLINPDQIWKGSLSTYAITGANHDSIDDVKYAAYIKIPNVKDANNKIISIAKDIGHNEDNILYNSRLLRLYAESLSESTNRSLISISSFIIILIVISTVAVIYNAFNISVLERISQFGLLRSVGATPKQIRGIVLREAFILSILGIPIGLFSGVLAMKIVLYIISLMKSDISIFGDMEARISGLVFLISTIIGLITVYLSAIGPAKRAGKVSPLEALRNTGNIKSESIKRPGRTIIIRRILGVEGEIAYKNLKRNRKRFLITVFSMVISISLFIIFSSFSDFMFKANLIELKEMGDFKLYGTMDGMGDKIYNDLKDMTDVKRVYKVRKLNGEALVAENKISKKLLDLNPYLLQDREEGIVKVQNMELRTIGDDNLPILKTLLKTGHIDIEKLNKENGVLIINNTYGYNEETSKRVLLEGYYLQAGDKLPVSNYAYYDKNKDQEYKELKVMGILEKGLLDFPYNYNSSITAITTEQVWENLFYDEIDDLDIVRRMSYTDMYIEMAEDGDGEDIRKYLEEIGSEISDFNYVDYAESAKEFRTMGIILSIFLYGFVVIITLISSINIINTISTNIILRTREIAMIKAVGMNQSRIKKMISYESIFYGIYGAVFGGAIGTGLTYIMFKIIIEVSEFEWIMPWQNIFTACIGATIIALLSGVYPLKRINEKIIVESIKVEN